MTFITTNPNRSMQKFVPIIKPSSVDICNWLFNIGSVRISNEYIMNNARVKKKHLISEYLHGHFATAFPLLLLLLLIMRIDI